MSETLTTVPGYDALPAYYQGYLREVEGVADILAALEEQGGVTAALLSDLTAAEETRRYAPGKWSVREVLGHVMDTERVFQLRALWFARGDTQPLPGFDENAWGANTNAGEIPMDRLLEEYAAVRKATLQLFGNLSEESLERFGEANGQRFQVGALPWFLLAHERHHHGVLREKYGIGEG